MAREENTRLKSIIEAQSQDIDRLNVVGQGKIKEKSPIGSIGNLTIQSRIAQNRFDIELPAFPLQREQPQQKAALHDIFFIKGDYYTAKQ